MAVRKSPALDLKEVVRTQAEADAPITKIRKGHWRNVWFIPVGTTSRCSVTGVLDTGPRELLSTSRYPSREVAEEAAGELLRENLLAAPHEAQNVYRGAAFFPEDN